MLDEITIQNKKCLNQIELHGICVEREDARFVFIEKRVESENPGNVGKRCAA